MNSFWDYSVEHYAKHGVSDACLALQDRYGLDVNLVLFCIWYGGNFGVLAKTELDQVMAFSELWAASVVKPLRQTRRWIKQHNEDLPFLPDRMEKFRNKVKKLELEAEHMQQDQLQQLLLNQVAESGAGSQDAVIKNLDEYLLRMGVEKSAEVVALLAAIT